MRDKNFRQTVIYISAYDPEEGALGMILNRPLEQYVSLFLPNEDLGALADAPSFFGGPVARDKMMFSTWDWDDDEGKIECHTHIELERAREIANDEEDEESHIRAFIGFTGWDAGQLENEIAQKTWFVQKPDRSILDMKVCGELWPTLMRTYKEWFLLLSAAPDDPSLN